MIKTILKSVREYKRASILTPVFVGLEVMLECMLPFIMAMLIDGMNGETIGDILWYGIVLLVIAFASLYCGVMSGRYAATASTGFAANLRHDIFYGVQEFAFADIDRFSTSSLVTRMTTDVTNVQNAYQMIIRIAVRTPMMFLFSIIMSFTINARMAMIFLCIIPFLALGLFLIMKTVMPVFKRIFKKYDALNNSVQENISGIRVVKSFVREDYEMDKFAQGSEDVRKDFTYAEKIIALNMPVMNLCLFVGLLLLNYVGAKMIISSGGSELTTGELSSLLTYGIQILISVMMLSMVFVMMTISEESARRISEVLEYSSTLTSPENGITEIADGSIEFTDVVFKYSENSKRPALSDINLRIESGQTIGIIGATGSSKTTLIQLIPRLYDVTEGSVKVGGVDVRDYDLDSLRDAVSVVLQKNVLFSGTIKENMRWGKADATDEEIEHACELAQANEFIEQKPEKYDFLLDQGGSNVSGGQRQRLCIARSLLKSPKILILDDSTSAVDTRTDALIRKAFREEIPDTTKLIIAQRISSVQDADLILVMDGGRIAEKGTHDELIALGGIYHEIYVSQVSGKEAAA